MRLFLLEQCIDEVACDEGAQVVDAFADADKADRLQALPGDGSDDAALGGAVEFVATRPVMSMALSMP